MLKKKRMVLLSQFIDNRKLNSLSLWKPHIVVVVRTSVDRYVILRVKLSVDGIDWLIIANIRDVASFTRVFDPSSAINFSWQVLALFFSFSLCLSTVLLCITPSPSFLFSPPSIARIFLREESTIKNKVCVFDNRWWIIFVKPISFFGIYK